MNTREKKTLGAGLLLLAAFVLWTILIQCVDVQPLGQNGTNIGFAALNCRFHRLCGVHMTIYTVTDWLGLVPIAVCLCFGGIGLSHLVKRRSLLCVDPDLILLGIYYLLVIADSMLFSLPAPRSRCGNPGRSSRRAGSRTTARNRAAEKRARDTPDLPHPAH